jgi:hypothetical protein
MVKSTKKAVALKGLFANGDEDEEEEEEERANVLKLVLPLIPMWCKI